MARARCQDKALLPPRNPRKPNSLLCRHGFGVVPCKIFPETPDPETPNPSPPSIADAGAISPQKEDPAPVMEDAAPAREGSPPQKEPQPGGFWLPIHRQKSLAVSLGF
jgi:hypothetical protein